jgi:formylglycine-generating enzyme required for sulfatase activity
MLALVCAGVLVGLGLWLLPSKQEQKPRIARAPSASLPKKATPLPVAHAPPAVSSPVESASPAVAPSASGKSPFEVRTPAAPRATIESPAAVEKPDPVEEPSPPAGEDERAPSLADLLMKEEEAKKAAAAQPKPEAPMPAEAEPIAPPSGDAPAIAVYPLTIEQVKETQQGWAKHLRQPIVSTNALDMKLVLIPPGQFEMGSPKSETGHEENEGPQRTVKLTRPYYIGMHEVTVGQFAKFVTTTGYKAEGLKREINFDRFGNRDDEDDKRRGFGPGRGFGRGRDNNNGNNANNSVPLDAWFHPRNAPALNVPVIQITWQDAVEFCNWLGEIEGKKYRLPTEAEWEFACRAGNLASTAWGDVSREHSRFAWFRENSSGRPRQVGDLKANALGLYDMHGNVAEWCADWMSTYPAEAETDPTGPSDGRERVVRGGAWDASRLGQRSAARAGVGPSTHNERIGFRVACDVDLAAGLKGKGK